MNRIVFTALACLAFVRGQLRADQFVVDANSAAIYANGKATGSLSQGEIFEGVIPPGSDWVVVRRNDTDFQVRSRDVKVRAEVEVALKQAIVQLETVVEQLDKDLAGINKEAVATAQLAVQVQRDTAVKVVFPGTSVRQLPVTMVNQTGTGTIMRTVPQVTVQPDTVATLTSSDAKKILKKLESDQQGLAEQRAALDARRQAATRQLTLQRLRLQSTVARLDRHSLFPDDYLRTSFVVAVSKAAVYRDRQRVGEYSQGQLLSGVISLKSDEWVTLPEYPGGAASIRGKDLRSEDDLMGEAALAVLLNSQAVTTAEAAIEELLASRDAIKAAHRDLGVLVERGDRYVQLNPADINRRRGEAVISVPTGAVETALPHEARKQMGDFEDALKALENTLAARRNELANARKQQVALDARISSLKKQFENAAKPAAPAK